MRTNIEIDDEALAELMALTGAKTKREAVNDAIAERLQHLKKRQAIEALRTMRGKAGWEGDLDAMRRDKPHDPLR